MTASIVGTLTQSQVEQAQSQAQAIANSATQTISKNQFVFFAAFDGTNNNANDPSSIPAGERTTNVAQLWDQGNRDTLYIDARSDQLWFRKIGTDLSIDIMGSQDSGGANPSNKVVIKNHYAGEQYQVERIVSGDGKVLTAANADQLVQTLSGLLENPGATSFNDASMTLQKTAWQNTANAVWSADATVSTLVAAMAQMAQPSAETTLTAASYQNRIAAIYAANVMN